MRKQSAHLLPATVALDFGKASIGICALSSELILLLESHDIPAKYAATADLRARLHAERTRKAHRRREEWFMESIWVKAGLPNFRAPQCWETLKDDTLSYYKTDKRLWTREFPEEGEDTIFNSALLRISLIEGKPLQPWQIWKALWSAIQKRGFYYYNWKGKPADLENIQTLLETMQAEEAELTTKISELDLAKRQERNSALKAELTEEIKQLKEEHKSWKAEYEPIMTALPIYEEQLVSAVLEPEKYGYPCYLEAYRMGLWECNPTTRQGSIKALRINHEAQGLQTFEKPNPETPEKKILFNERFVPRAYRIKELKALWKAAQKKLPQLKDFSAEYLLYGDSELPYATAWKQEFKRFRGKEKYDCQGVLGQKVPRFDNRIIAKCRLFPNRNVCNAKSDENKTFSLLSQLKNLRFCDTLGEIRGFTPEELITVFELVKNQLNTQSELSTTKLDQAVRQAVGPYNGFTNLNRKEKLKVNVSGRSRFCRPALNLMNEILCKGLNPSDVNPLPYVQAEDPTKGITLAEVNQALSRLGSSWEKFQVMDDREASFELAQSLQTPEEIRQAVMREIGTSNNPIVRHRLVYFYNILARLEKELEKKGYYIDRIIIEFIRGADSGFDGKKRAKDFDDAIKANEDKNDVLRADLKKYNLSPKYLEHMKLAEEQGWHCVYTKEPLSVSRLQDYDIDHIVPYSQELRSDALWNKVLVSRTANQAQKINKTPYEWLHQDEEKWDAFVKIVQSMEKLSKKKKALLTSPDAREKIKSYNGLAETSYIAGLAQKIVSLHFAWPLQNKGENRRVFVCDGATTADIRKKYKLNDLLLDEEQKTELEKLYELKTEEPEAEVQRLQKIRKLRKKNRENKKHHALDAFCIALSQSIHRDPEDKSWFVPHIEKWRPQLIQHLEDLFPKSVLKDKRDFDPKATSYGKTCVTIPKKLRNTYQGSDRVYTLAARAIERNLYDYLQVKDAKQILDPLLREAIEEELKNDKPGLLERLKKGTFRHPNRRSFVRNAKIIYKLLEGSDGMPAGDVCEMKGKQFRDFKETKERIIYKDQRGRWKALQLYPHHSLQTEKQRLIDAGFELFAEGKSLKNGTIFITTKPIEDVNWPQKSRDPVTKRMRQVSLPVTLPPGPYLLTKAGEELTKVGIKDSIGKQYELTFAKLLIGEPVFE